MLFTTKILLDFAFSFMMHPCPVKDQRESKLKITKKLATFKYKNIVSSALAEEDIPNIVIIDLWKPHQEIIVLS